MSMDYDRADIADDGGFGPAPDPAVPPPPPRAARSRRRPRVLVVQPIPADREPLCAHLRRAGYDVQAAADGLEALARAVARRPEAIVMDVAIPGLDAWEVTRRLKAAAATRDIPVIAVSAHDPAAGEKAHAAGCAVCLARPFQPEELRAEVERQLHRHRPRPRRRGRAGRM
jgi:CheY-like chemotaxis protein